MVARLAEAWGVPLDPVLAELLYTGVVFDTGAFRYSNTRPETHALAARLIATGFDHSAVVLRILVERKASSLRLMASIFGGARFSSDGRALIGEVSLETLRMAGAGESDLDGVVDILQHIEGVEVAGLVTERRGGAKVSLRSRGRLNVAELAKALHAGGGGHAKAAGVVIPSEAEFDELVQQVFEAARLAVG